MAQLYRRCIRVSSEFRSRGIFKCDSGASQLLGIRQLLTRVLGNHVVKIDEQRIGVVGTWRGLGVVLY